MAAYRVTMKHTEDSLVTLSRMQYDLFCGRNRAVRLLISAAAVLFGVVNYSNWWGILLIAYGCYLTTSTYSSSNRTAHKLARQIEASGKPYPHSKYLFENDSMHIVTLPENTELYEPLSYSRVFRLGEDSKYYYLFRDQYGGYMIPKEALNGKTADFKAFIEKKTGQIFISKRSPLRRFLAWQRRRENEPYHL